jgi:hypothetical protein
MNPRSLKAIIADQLEVKNITLEQLSTKTDVPEQYMKAIFNNQPERLPALPYIRNYLLTIADFLEIDQSIVLEAYRSEFTSKMSGSADRLPGNRFTLVRRGRKWIWIGSGIVVAALVLYAVLSSAFFGAPYFRLVNPPQDAEAFEVTGSTILLAGTTERNGKLTINDEMVPVQADGSFEFEFPLAAGFPNTVVFKVERFLGKTLVVTKQIYVRPVEVDAEASSTTSTAPIAPAIPTTSPEAFESPTF